jgi:Glyoxalase-like domain
MSRIALLVAGVVSLQGCQCSGSKSQDKSKDEADAAAVADDDALPLDPSSTLLGGERGLDHVGIAVKSLEHAAHVYQDLLGFGHPIEGKLGNGLRNANYYFGNATYIETLVADDREKGRWIADFADQHQGAKFAVLSVFSTEDTTKFLAGRDIQAGTPIPGAIQTPDLDAMPKEQWRTFSLPSGELPGDPFFFIAYRRDMRDDFLEKIKTPKFRQQFRHKNTALGLLAVWIAVEDLESATEIYASIGLSKGRSFEDAELGAGVQVFPAGIGEIWLVGTASPDSKVATFLKERGGPGIIGLTVEVGSVAQAQRAIATPTPLAMFEGAYGQAIRVGPDLAEGVWIEFTHRSSPSAQH